MNSISNAQLMSFMNSRPSVYEESPCPLWDDDHISAMMLEAHLNPDIDAASRKHSFIDKSAEWISELCGCTGSGGKKLLDLGCGPGLYTERLARKGFSVTGVDFSRRSISYAKQSAKDKSLNIEYLCKDYLELDYSSEFDAVILVYCDFGVLPPKSRRTLLGNIFRALKKGGMLILDTWNGAYLDRYEEGQSIRFENGGFWSPEPYVIITDSMIYTETLNTLEKYLVVTEDDCKCFHVWDQVFSAQTLTDELRAAGFEGFTLFDDISGKPYTDKEETICVAAVK